MTVTEQVLAWIEDKVGKWQYSGARRMKDGYVDCSSLVYRAYKAAGVTLHIQHPTSMYEPYAPEFELLYPKKKELIGRNLPAPKGLLESLKPQMKGKAVHIFYHLKPTARANKITHVSTVHPSLTKVMHARNTKVDVCYNALDIWEDDICAIVAYKDSAASGGGAPKPVLKRMLQNGSNGEDVKAVQKALIEAGYKCGKYGIDGIFGDVTESAVIAYQKAHKLESDGIVGKYTATSLGFEWKG